MAIEILEWDSRFFGYPVGSVTFPSPPAWELEILPILNQARQIGLRLLYLATPPLTDNLRGTLQRAGVKPVGIKVGYSKTINGAAPVATEIPVSPCYESSMELEALALQSGSHSRFHVDPGFQNREFERLYGEWLVCSLRGDGGKRVFIAGTINAPRGLITVEPGQIVRIGLLVVDPRWRGQGLGRRLVAEAEHFCLQNKYFKLQVATQAENHDACRFYESCGFSMINQTEYHHAWLPLFESKGTPP